MWPSAVIYRVAMIIVLVSFYGFFTGCARQPALTQASAPAPIGQPATAPPAPAPLAPAAPAPAIAPPAVVERPPVKDFTVVVDLRPIYFDFDKANRSYLVMIEGHCDERGTSAYNLALGERRARATLDYLTSRGVQRTQITVISYGDERPGCTEHNEACWSKNRRAVSVVKPG